MASAIATGRWDLRHGSVRIVECIALLMCPPVEWIDATCASWIRVDRADVSEGFGPGRSRRRASRCRRRSERSRPIPAAIASRMKAEYRFLIMSQEGEGREAKCV